MVNYSQVINHRVIIEFSLLNILQAETVFGQIGLDMKVHTNLMEKMS